MAGERAVRELGKRRGIPANGDLIAILKRLDQRDAKTRDDYYIVKLSGLMMLETHYRLGALESYWWEDLHRDVIAFIAHCHAAAALNRAWRKPPATTGAPGSIKAWRKTCWIARPSMPKMPKY